MNLVRIKFFGLFLCALCKVQSVSFEKLSTAFGSEAWSESSLRRIQRFMAEYVLDSDWIACFIFKLLPRQPPYRLAMDRTNWKIGGKTSMYLQWQRYIKVLQFPSCSQCSTIRYSTMYSSIFSS